CNPAYSGPGLLQFNDHVAKAQARIHAGLHADETAQLCQWHLPLSHGLESWSDGRAVDGSATIIQPVIAPLYASRSVHQLLDFLLGGDDPAPDAAVKTTWRSTFGTDFDDRWTRALHDGFVTGSGAQPVTISAKPPAPPQLKDNADDQVEIVFNPDP